MPYMLKGVWGAEPTVDSGSDPLNMFTELEYESITSEEGLSDLEGPRGISSDKKVTLVIKPLQAAQKGCSRGYARSTKI